MNKCFLEKIYLTEIGKGTWKMLSSVLMIFLLTDLLPRKHSKQDFNKPKHNSIHNQFTVDDLLSLRLSDNSRASFD